MRTLCIAATVASIGLCSCAGSPTQSASKGDPKAQVDAYFTRFLAEWDERDSDGMAELFAVDGVRVVSGDQLPAAGRKAIAKSFAGTMGDPTLRDRIDISITCEQARAVDNGLIIADGRFKATDSNGNVTLTGKWGNVFRMTDDGLLMVLESAHAEPSPDADPARFANMSNRAVGPARADLGNAAEHAAAMQALIDLYIEGFNTRNGTMLASAFTEDGAQIIGPLTSVKRGRAAIAEAASENLVGETLSATEIRARKLSDTLIAHNGLWETRAADGTVTGFGQWGNLLELQPDGSVRLLVESAGPFHGAK